MRLNIILLFLAMSLATVAASAQQKTAKERLDEIERLEVKVTKHRPVHEYEAFELRVLTNYHIGTHLISSEGFDSRFGHCRQVGFNLLDVVAKPSHWLGFHVGVGIEWDKYWSRDFVYSVDGSDNITVRERLDEERGGRKHNSLISTGSLVFPVLAEFSAGKFSFSAGAEGIYYYRAGTRTYLPSGSSLQLTKTGGANVGRLGYDFYASVAYSGFGLFVKYLPSSSRIFPEPGPEVGNRWTVGIRIGSF